MVQQCPMCGSKVPDHPPTTDHRPPTPPKRREKRKKLPAPSQRSARKAGACSARRSAVAEAATGGASRERGSQVSERLKQEVNPTHDMCGSFWYFSSCLQTKITKCQILKAPRDAPLVLDRSPLLPSPVHGYLLILVA